MKTNNTIAMIAVATGSLLFAANTAEAGSSKRAEKKEAAQSACSGPNGCDGKDFKCVGGNSCKGTSACKTAKSKCNGHNSCKGQGWIMTTSKEECDKLKKG